MITDYHIAMASQDDLTEMQRILQTSSHDWDARMLSSCFGASYKQWGIFFKGNLLGFAVIKKVTDHWELLQIVIDREYQSQGLAKRLLQYIIAEARIKKIKKIQLEVRRSNISASKLYHSAGFREVGVRKKYYRGVEDAVLMDLVL